MNGRAPHIPYDAVVVCSVEKVRMGLVSTTTSQDAPNASGQGASNSRLPARDRQVIAILLVATFVVILNETIMNVAMPRLMTELIVTASTAQWLATAYMLVMAVLIPTTGFLMQRFTTRTLFMTAMGVFAAGTLVAGSAPSFAVLLRRSRLSGRRHRDHAAAADDDDAGADPARAARRDNGQRSAS